MNWKDNYLKEIEELIKDGANRAYEENVIMCFDQTDFKSRMVEYLVVVNIAKLLMKWALPNNLQVQLEYSLADFYNGAFQTIKWEGKSIFDRKMIKRTDHNPPQNKSARIDIAITSDSFNAGIYIKPRYISLIGIEIKSISNQKKTILKDIHRLSHSLVLNDAIGKNKIKACYSLFYRRLDNYKKVNSKEVLEVKKEREIEKWNSVLNKIKNDYPSLNYILEPILVQESHVKDIINQFPTEHFDYSEVAEKSGLIMCYLIKIVPNAE